MEHQELATPAGLSPEAPMVANKRSSAVRFAAEEMGRGAGAGWESSESEGGGESRDGGGPANLGAGRSLPVGVGDGSAMFGDGMLSEDDSTSLLPKGASSLDDRGADAAPNGAGAAALVAVWSPPATPQKEAGTKKVRAALAPPAIPLDQAALSDFLSGRDTSGPLEPIGQGELDDLTESAAPATGSDDNTPFSGHLFTHLRGERARSLRRDYLRLSSFGEESDLLANKAREGTARPKNVGSFAEPDEEDYSVQRDASLGRVLRAAMMACGPGSAISVVEGMEMELEVEELESALNSTKRDVRQLHAGGGSFSSSSGTLETAPDLCRCGAEVFFLRSPASYDCRDLGFVSSCRCFALSCRLLRDYISLALKDLPLPLFRRWLSVVLRRWLYPNFLQHGSSAAMKSPRRTFSAPLPNETDSAWGDVPIARRVVAGLALCVSVVIPLAAHLSDELFSVLATYLRTALDTSYGADSFTWGAEQSKGKAPISGSDHVLILHWAAAGLGALCQSGERAGRRASAAQLATFETQRSLEWLEAAHSKTAASTHLLAIRRRRLVAACLVLGEFARTSEAPEINRAISQDSDVRIDFAGNDAVDERSPLNKKRNKGRALKSRASTTSSLFLGVVDHNERDEPFSALWEILCGKRDDSWIVQSAAGLALRRIFRLGSRSEQSQHRSVNLRSSDPPDDNEEERRTERWLFERLFAMSSSVRGLSLRQQRGFILAFAAYLAAPEHSAHFIKKAIGKFAQIVLTLSDLSSYRNLGGTKNMDEACMLRTAARQTLPQLFRLSLWWQNAITMNVFSDFFDALALPSMVGGLTLFRALSVMVQDAKRLTRSSIKSRGERHPSAPQLMVLIRGILSLSRNTLHAFSRDHPAPRDESSGFAEIGGVPVLLRPAAATRTPFDANNKEFREMVEAKLDAERENHRNRPSSSENSALEAQSIAENSANIISALTLCGPLGFERDLVEAVADCLDHTAALFEHIGSDFDMLPPSTEELTDLLLAVGNVSESVADAVFRIARAFIPATVAGKREHNFERQYFPSPTDCSICHKFVWGVTEAQQAGLRCTICGTRIHQKCESQARDSQCRDLGHEINGTRLLDLVAGMLSGSSFFPHAELPSRTFREETAPPNFAKKLFAQVQDALSQSETESLDTVIYDSSEPDHGQRLFNFDSGRGSRRFSQFDSGLGSRRRSQFDSGLGSRDFGRWDMSAGSSDSAGRRRSAVQARVLAASLTLERDMELGQVSVLRVVSGLDFGLPMTLMEFSRDCLLAYLASPSPVVRSAAACAVVSLVARGWSVGKGRHLSTGSLIRQVFDRLLTVAVSDPSSRVRFTVIWLFLRQWCSLQNPLGGFDVLACGCFDDQLQKSRAIETISLLLEDPCFRVRESALRLLARIFARNPAHVSPHVRRVLHESLAGISDRSDHAVLVGVIAYEVPAFFVKDGNEPTDVIVDRLSAFLQTSVSALEPARKTEVTWLSESRLISALDAAALFLAFGCAAQSLVGEAGEFLDEDGLEAVVSILSAPVRELASSSPFLQELCFWAMRHLFANGASASASSAQRASVINLVEQSFRALPSELLETTLCGELLRLLGVLGAMDPFRVANKGRDKRGVSKDSSMILALTKEATDRRAVLEARYCVDGDNLDASMAVEEVSLKQLLKKLPPRHPDYIPAVVVCILLDRLADKLNVRSAAVVQVLMQVLKSSGNQSVRFVPYVLPELIEAAGREQTQSGQVTILHELGSLLRVVGPHARRWLEDIVELVRGYCRLSDGGREMTNDSSVVMAALRIVSCLADSLRNELSRVLPKMMPTLLNLVPSSPSPAIFHRPALTEIVRAAILALRSLGNNLGPYLRTWVPKLLLLCRISASQLDSLNCERALILCRTSLSAVSSIFERFPEASRFSARVIPDMIDLAREVGQKMGGDEADQLLREAASVIMLCGNSLGFSLFRQTFLERVAQAKASFGPAASEILGPLLAGQTGGAEDTSEHFGRVSRDTTLDSARNWLLDADVARNDPAADLRLLRRAWAPPAYSHDISVDDWRQWFGRFSHALLQSSRSPPLRACVALVGELPQLIDELFNGAFYVCWKSLSPSDRDALFEVLQLALQASELPSSVLQALLSLAEYMERADEALPFDAIALAALAYEAGSHTLAVRFQESVFFAEMESERGLAVVDSLIETNSQLRLFDASTGAAVVARANFGDDESGAHGQWGPRETRWLQLCRETRWLEALLEWDSALTSYSRQLSELSALENRTAAREGSANDFNFESVDSTRSSLKLVNGSSSEPQVVLQSSLLIGAARCLLAVAENNQAGLVSARGIHLVRKSDIQPVQKEQFLREFANIGATSMWYEGTWDRLRGFIGDGPELNFSAKITSSRAILAVNDFVESTADENFRDGESFACATRGEPKYYKAVEAIQLARKTWEKKLVSKLRIVGLARCYKYVLALQHMTELEEALLLAHPLTLGDQKSAIRKVWRMRLGQARRDISTWRQMIAVRNVVLSASEQAGDLRKFSKLCRVRGQFKLASNQLVGANALVGDGQNPLSPLFTDGPDAMPSVLASLVKTESVAQARLSVDFLEFLWNLPPSKAYSLPDNQQTAESLMRGFIEVAVPAHGQDDPHFASRTLRKLGDWEMIRLRRLDQSNPQTVDLCSVVIDRYKRSLEYDPSYYHAWHGFAMANLRMRRITPAERVESFVISAMKGFFRGIALSRGPSIRDTLRILQLWYEFPFSDSNARPKTIDLVQRGKDATVHGTFLEGCSNIPPQIWLQVIPQLLARIDAPAVSAQVSALLLEVGRIFPQVIAPPLLCAKLSQNSRRSRLARAVLDKMRIPNEMSMFSAAFRRAGTRAEVGASQAGRMSRFLDEAEMVSVELIRIAVLWDEQWYEKLLDVRLKLIDGEDGHLAMAELAPLHKMVERGAATPEEEEFLKLYGKGLAKARAKLLRRKNAQGAWDAYNRVLQKLHKSLPTSLKHNLARTSPRLAQLSGSRVAVFGSYLPVRPAPGVPQPDLIAIDAIRPRFTVMRSKQRPRRFVVLGSNGSEYMFLLKGREDQRQDERVMQFLGLVDSLLSASHETRRRHLGVVRYSVVPLSPSCGVVGWVPHTDTLHGLIVTYRRSRKVAPDVENRLIQESAPDFHRLPALNKVDVFEDVADRVSGQDLARVMWLKSESSEAWIDQRINFSRSLAVMSVAGHVLGLGDRHPNNIMLDRKSGTVVHIDFGDCFEVARFRKEYPEQVPFRLTRMLVNAMEVTGIEGTFRMTCEAALTVLRQEQNSLLSILEAFVEDPIINWRFTMPSTDESSSSSGQDGSASDSKGEASSKTGASLATTPLPTAGSPTDDGGSDGDAGDTLGVSYSASVRGPRSRADEATPLSLRGDQGDGVDADVRDRALKVLTRIQTKLDGTEFSRRAGRNAGAGSWPTSGVVPAAESSSGSGTTAEQEGGGDESNGTGTANTRVDFTNSGTGLRLSISRAEPQSVPDQVRNLINEATSFENLTQHFLGWCPLW